MKLLDFTIPKTEVIGKYPDEVHARNLEMFHMMGALGIPVSIANLLVQVALGNSWKTCLASLVLLAWFVVLHFLYRFVLVRFRDKATLLMYLCQAPVLLISILTGTVLDTSHTAVSFFLFILILPLYTLDYPSRIILVTSGWSVLFLAMDYVCKPAAIFHADFYHLLEFYLACVVTTLIVLYVRMENLQSDMLLADHAEHDELTHLNNLYTLEKESPRWYGHDVLVILFNFDNFNFFNDLYSHAAGDQMLQAYAGELERRFGHDSCYRNGGDEFLVITELTRDAALPLMHACTDGLTSLAIGHRKVHPVFSCGYTWGKLENAEQLADMIRLADVNGFTARGANGSRIVGTPFSKDQVRAGAVEARMNSAMQPSETDSLTGLPNRSFFLVRAEELAENVVDFTSEVDILYFNLAGLHNYNESRGFEAGDRLLRAFGSELREAFPERMVSRFGEDHFACMVSRGEIETGLEKLRRNIESCDDTGLVSVQCGFARLNRGDFISLVCDEAKQACDSLHGRPDLFLQEYDEAFELRNKHTQYVLEHIDEAVREHWIHVYYQPIVRATTGQVCDEEALARWIDPVLGIFPPDQFVPVLEAHRLTWKLDLAVLDQVLSDFDIRRRENIPIVPVSINLSRYDFEAKDMVEEVTRRIDAAGYAHSMITIEITESAYSEHMEKIQREIDRFHAAGFQVWMDDFGSGYSSLNLLQDSDFDLIKLDMRFMKHFGVTNRNTLILEDIIDMAKKLHIRTLTEGVETQEMFEVLRELGCERMQGYLFSKPVPLDVIREQRASGEGLVYEDPVQAPFYERIGILNLNDPLAYDYDDTHKMAEHMVKLPCAVLSMDQEGNAYLLRSNSAYMELLGIIHAGVSEEDHRLYVNSSTEGENRFQASMRRAVGSDGWETESEEAQSQRGTPISMNIYFHRVVRNEATGSWAVLVIVFFSNL